MQGIELKPCPFCGGKAVVFVNDGVRVLCVKCNAQTRSLVDNVALIDSTSAVESVVAAWNRRTGE